MISMKARYALKALVHIATQEADDACIGWRIAELENIPPKFMGQILMDLRRHGILRSKVGKYGGYGLRKSPDVITLKSILSAIKDPLVMELQKARCQKLNPDIAHNMCHLIDPFQDRLIQARDEILEGVSLAHLVKWHRHSFQGDYVVDFQI